jgi:general secretion pathway protein A
VEQGVTETFYGSFYQLRSPPFHITPDASLLFATQTHQQALGAIEYGIAAGKGFVVVTGEVGVGKTTVLRSVLDGRDPAKSRVIYIFNPSLNIADLYAAILEGLDASATSETEPAGTLGVLQHVLLQCHERGVEVILAIDEAQNMSEATLEHLRVLSNLETTKSKLLQIILVGQPELDVVLRRRSMRQLSQRVAVRARIAPLTFRQSCRYIQHRLLCAGRPPKPTLFTLPALWYLAIAARGVPRSLNIYCDNALINGYGYRAERLSLRLVFGSIGALKAKPGLLDWRLGWIVAIVILAAASTWFPRNVDRTSSTKLPRPETAVAPSARAAVETPDQQSRKVSVEAPLASQPVLPSIPMVVEAQDHDTKVPTTPQDAIGFVGNPTKGDAAIAQKPEEKPQLPESAPGVAEKIERGAVSKWRVRNGDTLFKACRVTYGQCVPAELKEIFVSNPKINSRGAIRPGDVIIIPNEAAASRPN